MIKTNSIFLVCTTLFLIIPINFVYAKLNNPIVDTGQVRCYNNSREILCPKQGQPFYGQDAQYEGNVMSYPNNGNGTVTDLNTGLMWSKAVEKNKVSFFEARKIAQRMTLGGYSDWRLPNIKELYSLIDFRGYTGFSRARSGSKAIPFINTDYFDFEYGDVSRGERYIDAQWLSGTKYVSTTMNGVETLFGVNFADGRIKGYGYHRPGRSREKKFYARYVRGNADGENDFTDNGDDTVTDRATGLMWTQKDSGRAMNWEDALEYAENLVYAGYDDWRLPNAKELQFIADYSRSPDTADSPAINPVLATTSIVNEGLSVFLVVNHPPGRPDSGKKRGVCRIRKGDRQNARQGYGCAGTGAQRSDPKSGNPAKFHGPREMREGLIIL